LNHHLYIRKNSKWRNQEMKIRIAIPEGKKIRFADNIDYWLATVKRRCEILRHRICQYHLDNRRRKLKCIEGENHRNADKSESKDSENQHDKARKHSKRMKEKKERSDEEKDKDF